MGRWERRKAGREKGKKMHIIHLFIPTSKDSSGKIFVALLRNGWWTCGFQGRFHQMPVLHSCSFGFLPYYSALFLHFNSVSDINRAIMWNYGQKTGTILNWHTISENNFQIRKVLVAPDTSISTWTVASINSVFPSIMSSSWRKYCVDRPTLNIDRFSCPWTPIMVFKTMLLMIIELEECRRRKN